MVPICRGQGKGGAGDGVCTAGYVGRGRLACVRSSAVVAAEAADQTRVLLWVGKAFHAAQ